MMKKKTPAQRDAVKAKILSMDLELARSVWRDYKAGIVDESFTLSAKMKRAVQSLWKNFLRLYFASFSKQTRIPTF